MEKEIRLTEEECAEAVNKWIEKNGEREIYADYRETLKDDSKTVIDILEGKEPGDQFWDWIYEAYEQVIEQEENDIVDEIIDGYMMVQDSLNP